MLPETILTKLLQYRSKICYSMGEDNNMSVRADLVKMGRLIDMDRPGLAQPFMVPTKLKNQVRGTPLTNLQYDPRAYSGGTQWRISVQRPGLAQPLITAKQEKIASEAVVQAMQAKGPAPAAADRAMVAVANAANKPASGVAGFFSGLAGLAGWGRRGR